MPRSKKIPIKPRFDKARRHAYDLLVRLGVEKFPVDPLCIRDYFPNIRILSYTELQNNTGEADPFDFDKKNARIDAINAFIVDPKKKLSHVDGITVIERGTNTYLVVYDDRIGNEQRVRWTIAHELGHIFCGHLLDFEQTAINRGGLTKEQYGVLEVEANWFVSEFLAPRAVLGVFKFDKPNEIALLCDISKEASEKRFRQLKRPTYNLQPDDVFRNFFAHLASGEYHKVIFTNLCDFVYAPFYNELADVCRICRDCGTIITETDDKHCYYCGKDSVAGARNHTAIVEFSDGVINFNSARISLPQVPFAFEAAGGTDTRSRLAFCPVCKNSEVSNEAGFCRICGSSLANICHDCFKELPVECRYCPACGYESTLKPLYERVSDTNAVSCPDEYDDYIEYDYWDFVKMTIGFWDEKDKALYACLSDSTMYRDDGDFIIVTPHKQTVRVILDNLGKIKARIIKYGKTTVDAIKCICIEGDSLHAVH